MTQSSGQPFFSQGQPLTPHELNQLEQHIADNSVHLIALEKDLLSTILTGNIGKVSGFSKEHLQYTPSDSWVINHNLGRKPLVQVYTLGGVKMLTEVLHVSNNQALVRFDEPHDGYAEII